MARHRLRTPCRGITGTPWIRISRGETLQGWLMPSSFVSPLAEYCRGTMPSKAVNSRKLRETQQAIRNKVECRRRWTCDPGTFGAGTQRSFVDNATVIDHAQLPETAQSRVNPADAFVLHRFRKVFSYEIWCNRTQPECRRSYIG